jgi:hypothetical protein
MILTDNSTICSGVLWRRYGGIEESRFRSFTSQKNIFYWARTAVALEGRMHRRLTRISISIGFVSVFCIVTHEEILLERYCGFFYGGRWLPLCGSSTSLGPYLRYPIVVPR